MNEPTATATPAAVSAADFVTPPPPVNPAAVKLDQAPQEGGTSAVPPPQADQSLHPRDDRGNPFDPVRHLPKKHPKTGVWLPKRQPKAGTAAPAGSPFVAPDPEPPAPPPPPSEYRIAAEAACAITYALGMTIGGDEWSPTTDEHAQLLPAWETYLKTKQVRDVPPGLALTIAMLAYAGPRFSRPKTLSRLQKIKLWFVSWRANAAGHRRADAIQASKPEGVA